MLSENDASQASVKAMLSSNNINIDSLKLLKHNHNIEDLINNKTDIISGYISKYPFALKEKRFHLTPLHQRIMALIYIVIFIYKWWTY